MAALDVHFQDDDLLDPAAVPLDRVQRGPAGRRGRVQPNDFLAALAFAAQQAAAWCAAFGRWTTARRPRSWPSSMAV
jgi:hypothetical protein